MGRERLKRREGAQMWEEIGEDGPNGRGGKGNWEDKRKCGNEGENIYGQGRGEGRPHLEI